MAQAKRQSNLFTAENWSAVYESFREINLQAYDFATIKDSMIDHIRTVYPDDFNDWINNQEFIFILDTLAFLGQNLAFRMDLNSRENFISTAERKESILRLANMLSYNSKRNYPSRGLLKLSEIQTTEDIRDSNGRSLQNVPIHWNDELNPDWREQFILVINSLCIANSQFGSPIKRINNKAITTELYRMNTLDNSSIVQPFSKNVAGSSQTFEIVNPDFDNNGMFFERTPDPLDRRHIIYRSDGNGDESPDTGFFVYFKQGTLSKSDYNYSVKTESRKQIIDKEDINETDVWVQQISNVGDIINEWISVPSTSALPYNDIPDYIGNVFKAQTLSDDKVSIEFPTSETGSIPFGIFRYWYRQSNGLSYTIKTNDMSGVNTTYKYTASGGKSANVYSVSMKSDLQYEVQNAQSTETIEQIRERAPDNYYMQDRIISGEDYNIAPLRQGNIVLKSKALNRTYSGNSAFIDINDPTGNYQNVNMFGDDGILYQHISTISSTTSSLDSASPESIIMNEIEPLLESPEVNNLFYSAYSHTVPLTDVNGGVIELTWEPHTDSDLSLGNFIDINMDIYEIPLGTQVKFADDTWVTVVSNSEILGNVYYVLSSDVDRGLIATHTNTQYDYKFTSVERIILQTELQNKTPFSMTFGGNPAKWHVVTDSESNLVNIMKPVYIETFEDNVSWVLSFVPSENNTWLTFVRGLYYTFESENTVKFYFTDFPNQVSNVTGLKSADTLKILKDTSMGVDKILSVVGDIKTKYGYSDPNKARVSYELNDVGDPIDPDIFNGTIGNEELFWKTTDNMENYIGTDKPIGFGKFDLVTSIEPSDLAPYKGKYVRYITPNQLNFLYYVDSMLRPIYTLLYTTVKGGIDTHYYLNDEMRYVINDNGDSVYSINRQIILDDDLNEYEYSYRVGSLNTYFQYKHIAVSGERIDPSITNINDIYVLTTSYYNSIQEWVGTAPSKRGIYPIEPSTFDLTVTFASLEKNKSISDTIIWHSAKFRRLFGDVALGDEDLQASFKVMRLNGSIKSDNELKQSVIDAVNRFFNIDNWSFGDSFYYTELSTYIHQELNSDVASVVIVPKNGSSFGTLFEIPSNPYELFISTATVHDVNIISGLTQSNLNF